MKFALLKIFTVLWLMGMYITLTMTFLVAYQSPQKAVLVDINSYQEANAELLMMLTALFASTIGAAFLILDIKDDFMKRSARLTSRASD